MMFGAVLAVTALGFSLPGGAPVVRLPGGMPELRRTGAARMQADQPPPPMPAAVAAAGCDDALWSAIKNKRGLTKLANAGDEEHTRSRVATLRELVKNPPPTPPAAPKPAPKPTEPRKAKAVARQQSLQRKDGPYSLYGDLPEGMDAVAIGAQVEERSGAKLAKDYAKADAIREALAAQGIRIRDDFRTWSHKPAAPQ